MVFQLLKNVFESNISMTLTIFMDCVGSLGPDFNLDASASVAEPQTPAPCSTRPTCLRRRVKREYTSSDEEDTESLIQSVVPNIPQTTNTPAHKGQARLQQ